MNISTQTYRATQELDNYLKNHNYYAIEKPDDSINQEISFLWKEKIEAALRNDLKSKFSALEFDFISSVFHLISDEQGACLFLHHVIIKDGATQESIKVFIKILISQNLTKIYLDSKYAITEMFKGESKLLKLIFEKLKAADKDFGYFSPLLLETLIK